MEDDDDDDEEEEAGDAIDDGANVIGDFNRRDCAVDNTWRECAYSTCTTKTTRVANGRRRRGIALLDDKTTRPGGGASSGRALLSLLLSRRVGCRLVVVTPRSFDVNFIVEW